MTAKKMTDIFFGKFSELISTKSELEKTTIPSEVAIPREKKAKNKLFIIVSVVIVSVSYTHLTLPTNREV